MKVLFLINGLGTGGAERSLAEMLPFFQMKGLSPSLVCQNDRREGVQKELLEQGYPIHFLGRRGFWGKLMELRQLLRDLEPDLLHTTIFESDLLGRFGCIGFDVPLVTSLVNCSYDSIRRTDPNIKAWKLETVRVIDGWSGRLFNDHFHAITEAVKASSVRHLGLPADRITVIERGRDPLRLGRASAGRRRRTRGMLGIPEDTKLILNVARQEHQKGQKVLLKAVARLCERYPKLELLIAGREGNATVDLLSLRNKLGLEEKVWFLGHRNDVPDLLAAADVFVFPSLYEGLPGAVIEAMALEAPIVASRIPAMEEILEDEKNALLTPPGEPDPLGHAIGRMLEDPESARRLGVRGREIFEERFTLERSAHRMADLLLEIGGRGDRPASLTGTIERHLVMRDSL